MSTIRKLREMLGLTQAQLAKNVATSQPQIRRLEAGERQLTKDWAERLAPHLGTTASELMFGEEPPALPDKPALKTSQPALQKSANPVPANARLGELLPELHAKLPVYGQAVGGIDGEFVMNGERLEDVFSPPSLSAVIGAYAVYVSGESMEPRYFDGEIVYVNPAKRVRRGDFVVAQIQSEEHGSKLAYVKRFVRWNSTELVLSQYNPEKELRFQANHVVSVHLAVMGGAV
ncbi:MAG: helix-turn-helix transcriptional regulator [Rhizobiaceae bacterium]|nr:helix-turn-helix transcriptional regulator [Rhizobiaceae bacterium]